MDAPIFTGDRLGEDLYKYLSGHSKVFAQIGYIQDGLSFIRLYPDVALMETTYPFAVWTQTGEDNFHSLNDAGGCPMARIQLDIYAKSAASRGQVTEAFRLALDGMVNKIVGLTQVCNIRIVDKSSMYIAVDDGTDTGDYREILQLVISYMRSVPVFN